MPGVRTQRITVSVIGSHEGTPETARLAQAVGRMVAEEGCVLVCGGRQGLMKESCRGAKSAGGLTIGIMPGKDKAEANEFVDIALPTTIGFTRNVIVAASADVVIALPGSYGTENEICFARIFDRPVINLGGWKIKGLIPAGSVPAARKILKRLIAGARRG